MSFHDLEQGRGIAPEQELEAESNHDASRGENPKFMKLTEQVGLHVFRINANVATLQKLDAQLRRAPDLAQGKTDQIMRQFADLCEQTRSIVKDATDDVKKLSLYPIGGNEGYGIRRSSPSRLMQTKLQNDFQDALNAFQQIQNRGSGKRRLHSLRLSSEAMRRRCQQSERQSRTSAYLSPFRPKFPCHPDSQARNSSSKSR